LGRLERAWARTGGKLLMTFMGVAKRFKTF
jgi:hypothetical protein